MRGQKVLAVSGVKNSGKTTLIQALIPALGRRGVSVATVKHDGHRFEADRPGTDSCRHLSAGAMGSAVFDGEKFQLVKFAPVREQELIALFPEADLILLEGFKASAWPKIEIVRSAVSQRPVCEGESLLALVTDVAGLSVEVPVFGLNDVEKLSDFLLAWMGEA